MTACFSPGPTPWRFSGFAGACLIRRAGRLQPRSRLETCIPMSHTIPRSLNQTVGPQPNMWAIALPSLSRPLLLQYLAGRPCQTWRATLEVPFASALSLKDGAISQAQFRLGQLPSRSLCVFPSASRPRPARGHAAARSGASKRGGRAAANDTAAENWRPVMKPCSLPFLRPGPLLELALWLALRLAATAHSLKQAGVL